MSVNKFLDSSIIQITLKNVHPSDYGIILTWAVNLRNDEFKCNALFVCKETNPHDILLDSSPVSVNLSFYSQLTRYIVRGICTVSKYSSKYIYGCIESHKAIRFVSG